MKVFWIAFLLSFVSVTRIDNLLKSWWQQHVWKDWPFPPQDDPIRNPDSQASSHNEEEKP